MKKIEVTMEKRYRVAMEFDATEEQLAMLKLGMNPFKEELEEKIENGEVEYDYAVADEDGAEIVPWDW